MKKIFLTYAAYNVWATQQIIDCALKLPEEKLHQEINSSFNSVFKTFMHMWDAESIWWQRMKLAEHVEAPGKNFTGDFKKLSVQLIGQSVQWKEWVENATEAALTHEFIYQNTKREQFKQPMYEVLFHLFNHGTYHRGQLITMLRQLGVTNPPATDMIIFLRKK